MKLKSFKELSCLRESIGDVWRQVANHPGIKSLPADQLHLDFRKHLANQNLPAAAQHFISAGTGAQNRIIEVMGHHSHYHDVGSQFMDEVKKIREARAAQKSSSYAAGEKIKVDPMEMTRPQYCANMMVGSRQFRTSSYLPPDVKKSFDKVADFHRVYAPKNNERFNKQITDLLQKKTDLEVHEEAGRIWDQWWRH